MKTVKWNFRAAIPRISACVWTACLISPVSCAETVKVEDLFKQHCASCHGLNLEGGLGLSLVDGEWTGDGSDESIRQAIVKGNPQMEMPVFGDVLNDEEIRALVIYIREKEKAQLRSGTELPRAHVGKVSQTKLHSYTTEMVVDGLKQPWGMAFLPDGGMLVTEKPGSIRIVDADGRLHDAPVKGVPDSVSHGQGGMMEVALHPEFRENGWIYLGLTGGNKRGGRIEVMTEIHRGKIKDGKWVDNEVIFKADEEFYRGSGAHFGTRIVFDDDGYLYFIVGERGENKNAQNLANPFGKVFRMFDDGKIPQDIPYPELEGNLKATWTYGHRNPQGMAKDVRDGRIYVTEHGPRGGDEFNLLEKGANYGWPAITHGMNYNGTPITSKTAEEGMKQPLLHWTPSIAPCGLAQYTGDAFPEWKHDFFAGSLRQQELHRLRVTDQEVAEDEIILKDAGRIRQIVSGPDGYLYVVLNNPDWIIRLVPAE